MTAPDPAMVVVGAGQAGGRAALTLREAGHAGRIVLLGSEGSPGWWRSGASRGARGPARPRDGLKALLR
jgi:3-phenylpropionate/trans-cinnamate dioxygenase ferredoxin reductase subunit